MNLLQDDMTTNSTAFRPVHLQELHWDYLNKATKPNLKYTTARHNSVCAKRECANINASGANLHPTYNCT